MTRLKEIREFKGISQKDFAAIIGVPANTYNQWENGKRQPDPEIMIMIADYYDITLDYLMGRESPAKENPSEQIEGIDETSIEILNVCADLSLEAKEKVLSYIRFLKQDEENKQNP